MDPAGPVGQHLPLVQGKQEEDHGSRGPGGKLPLLAVPADGEGRYRQSRRAQHHVKGRAVLKQLHIDDPLQVVDRDPRQDIPVQIGSEAPHVLQIGIDEADVVRVHHVLCGAPDIGGQKEEPEQRQKPCCHFSAHRLPPFPFFFTAGGQYSTVPPGCNQTFPILW